MVSSLTNPPIGEEVWAEIRHVGRVRHNASKYWGFSMIIIQAFKWFEKKTANEYDLCTLSLDRADSKKCHLSNDIPVIRMTFKSARHHTTTPDITLWLSPKHPLPAPGLTWYFQTSLKDGELKF